LEKIIKIFAQNGYRGYLHIEYEAKEEPRVAIPKIAAQLREIVNRVAPI
ncbi:MAG: sugar phosphate isomerase/epimerase, partial [Calditrichaeota bacterium]|nr:sugar phosphate isomerase/epimerase [Calditrichota bacterium]